MGPGFAVMIPAPDGAHAVRLSEIANAEKHIVTAIIVSEKNKKADCINIH